MKRLSWKYIAGLVDGEGCIDAVLNKSSSKAMTKTIIPRIRITLVENCYFLLDILKVNHGGWINKRHFNNPKWQDPITWTLQGKKLRSFLQNIANHLTIKKQQALLAIWIQDHLRHKGMPQSEEVKQGAIKEMKAMKTDPQRLSEVAIRNIKNLPGFHGHWSATTNQCLDCGETSRKHEARGLCTRCYKKYQRSDRCDSLAV